jgi:hypothetical protein
VDWASEGNAEGCGRRRSRCSNRVLSTAPDLDSAMASWKHERGSKQRRQMFLLITPQGEINVRIRVISFLAARGQGILTGAVRPLPSSPPPPVVLLGVVSKRTSVRPSGCISDLTLSPRVSATKPANVTYASRRTFSGENWHRSSAALTQLGYAHKPHQVYQPTIIFRCSAN